MPDHILCTLYPSMLYFHRFYEKYTLCDHTFADTNNIAMHNVYFACNRHTMLLIVSLDIMSESGC